jgi:hypothetical protein
VPQKFHHPLCQSHLPETQEKEVSTYNSFPESKHVLAALQIINDGFSNDFIDKQSSGSKFSGFGPTAFPGVYNVKDYTIK